MDFGADERTLPAVPTPGRTRLPGRCRGLVSIVMPVYNHAGLVGEAIAAILSQTYPHWELIIVDDGSTDGLAQRVRPFAADRRVLFLRQPNQKLPAALNFGFRFARGQFLTWTSADNAMLPTQLEVLVSAIEAHPSAGVVYSDYRVIDDRGEPLDNAQWRPHNRDPLTPDLIRLPGVVTIENLHSRNDNFIGPSFLYRREIADSVGRYSDHAFGAEDYDFWLRAHLATEFHHVAEPLYKYRVHDDCLSARLDENDFFSTVQEVLEADRWRIRTYLVAGLRPQGGPSFWRPLEQFDAALLARFHPVTYAALAGGSFDGSLEQPVVLDVDVDTAEQDLDPLVLERADILLCRSAVTACLFREASWAYAKRILMWDGEVTEAIRHAFIQALGDKATAPTPHPIRTTPRLDQHCYPGSVLLLVERWDPRGIGQTVAGLARGLAERGCAVTVAAARGEAPPVSPFAGTSVRCFSFDGDEAAFDVFLRRDAVEIVNYHETGFGAERAAGLSVANIYTLHAPRARLDRSVRNQLASELASMDRVIAVSHRVGLFAETHLGYPGEKITIVPHAALDAGMAAGREPAAGDAPTLASERRATIENCLLSYALERRGGARASVVI